MPTEIETQLAALREAAAIAPLPDRAFLRITGPDAARWLNGMVTNNITALAPGEGNYNFLLNAQGRIQGDCTLYREPDSDQPAFLLETDAIQLDAIQDHLDKFIIMDDVELNRLEMTGVGIAGKNAYQYCLEVSIPYPGFAGPEPPAAPTHGKMYRRELENHEQITLYPPEARGDRVEVDRVEIWSPNSNRVRILERRLLQECGAKEISPATLEALRILEARPRFGQDITDKYLPQETAQTHALHFSKGCYLGQEIVERIHSRGQVHRTFTRVRLTGTLPESLPTPLESAALSPGGQAKPAGELTSAIQIGPAIHALGYIRRELLDTHAPLTYPGGTATPIATL